MTAPEQRGPTVSAPARAVVVSVGFVALLWVVEIVDAVLPTTLDAHGVHPRDGDGLGGILLAPLLHGSWGHLVSNSVPLLVLGFLLALSGLRTWLSVTAVVWLVGGAGVWLVGVDHTNHIGASGLVFGWLVHLVVRGVFARSLGQIAMGVVVFLVYGGILWGVLPGRPGVSWEGHLFGAIGGALAAWLLAARGRDV